MNIMNYSLYAVYYVLTFTCFKEHRATPNLNLRPKKSQEQTHLIDDKTRALFIHTLNSSVTIPRIKRRFPNI